MNHDVELALEVHDCNICVLEEHNLSRSIMVSSWLKFGQIPVVHPPPMQNFTFQVFLGKIW
jgi:hypothetical protein